MSIAASRGAELPFPERDTAEPIPDPVDFFEAGAAFGTGAALAGRWIVVDGLAAGLLFAARTFATGAAGLATATAATGAGAGAAG